MTLPQLDQLYNKFWMNFTDALPDNISYYPPSGNAFTVKKLKKNEFEIIISIDFKRIKYRASSNKVLDLAIRLRGKSCCVFDEMENSKLTKSNVKVNYFFEEETKNNPTLKLIESLHYDYENDKNSLFNHPVFHCQICNDCVEDQFFGRTYDFTNTRETVHQHLRLPTANMDMISVLLSIAADHFPRDIFEEIRKVYDKGDWHNILPHISHYGNKFSPNNCYRSRAWYIG